ncbi:MAG: hypothetical protein H0T73_12515 [Ardenticatenales bacterium]|nr:hypothetical protein [Ardenticatenales bacterium]
MLKSVIRALSSLFGILLLLYVSVIGSSMVAWLFGGGDGPPNSWYWPLFLGTLLLSLLVTLYVARFVGRKLKAKEGYLHS